MSHFLASPNWLKSRTILNSAKRKEAINDLGCYIFSMKKGGKQGQNLLLGEQEWHYAHGEFLLLKFVCDVLCITCGDDNKRKGLAKSLGWPGEPLVFIHGHVSLLRVFQGKNPA